jgi:hypothetical protein
VARLVALISARSIKQNQTSRGWTQPCADWRGRASDHQGIGRIKAILSMDIAHDAFDLQGAIAVAWPHVHGPS